MIGKTLSHYKVIEKIGQGGMGEVYRATDTKLNRDVALKILPQQFASDTQRMARFQREAEVLASLLHQHRCNPVIGLQGGAIRQVDCPHPVARRNSGIAVDTYLDMAVLEI